MWAAVRRGSAVAWALVRETPTLTGASPLERESPLAALPDDVTGGGKVRGEDQHAGVGEALHERAPRRGGPRRLVAEAARPLGLGDLHHAVHEVAREHPLP